MSTGSVCQYCHDTGYMGNGDYLCTACARGGPAYISSNSAAPEVVRCSKCSDRGYVQSADSGINICTCQPAPEVVSAEMNSGSGSAGNFDPRTTPEAFSRLARETLERTAAEQSELIARLRTALERAGYWLRGTAPQDDRRNSLRAKELILAALASLPPTNRPGNADD